MSVGWGIIGIGVVADIAIAPAINAHETSRLAAVCSRSLDRATAFAEKHGAASGYDDYTQCWTTRTWTSSTSHRRTACMPSRRWPRSAR